MKPAVTQDSPQGSPQALDPTNQNVAAVQAFVLREERKLSHSQRGVEALSTAIGCPAFLAVTLALVVGWALLNAALPLMGRPVLDPAPYFWLQGLIGLGALLISSVVLSKQNRVAKLFEQRAHLDLTVALLTEQKVAKLIDLLEELRRDLPDVRNRHDSDAAVLQKAMHPDQVMATLDEAFEAPAAAARVDISGELPDHTGDLDRPATATAT
jgi:uncharacterized membrane protein